MECAESTVQDVRGRDPNVTEQAGTRLAARPVPSGPVTSPRTAARQNTHCMAAGRAPSAVSTPPRPNPPQNGPGHVLQHAAKPGFPGKRSSPRAPVTTLSRPVAGEVTERRRSGPKVSQVLVFSLICDGNRGQEVNSVADQPFFQDLRRFAGSPATPPVA